MYIPLRDLATVGFLVKRYKSIKSRAPATLNGWVSGLKDDKTVRNPPFNMTIIAEIRN